MASRRLMLWQDVVFTLGGVVFLGSLASSIVGPTKPPATMSAPTAALLSVYVVADISLGLMFTAVTAAVTAAAWWTLAFQVWRRRT